MTYRFCGAFSEVGSTRLERLGQSVDFTQEQADEAILGGCILLTEEQYASIGFTPEEQKRYAYIGSRLSAPQAFALKMRKGWELYHDARAKLLTERNIAFEDRDPIVEALI